ncbi:hypothetical protein VOLCADRAFT_118229 [Volvox carteri f. nagariensis]|uniref:Uncharacterized protein n=1 Tax=Volvox carteri f. nagariensis TaxID=3068 RepID=D8U2T9_VOLCA|nr:uncharacterized protein VOLCADRAFT_118229 [Volvox carteri f. nagariensis]EFJ45862.1 hypothetical protein VOLCADRAFT_118229 [Volvox carteri f. nagariensis]|eukprot:XP_002952940.1 hypothetical protein VOLCADRAFT_118229 [Volvox carteri f. nagariensis]
MRERKDKDTPNASRVYLRIKESIINHVDQEVLVGTLKEALLVSPVYAGDRSNMNPKQKADLEKDVEAWRDRRAAMEAARRSALSSRPYPGEDEEPVSPPPASPPPPGYFDGLGDFQDDELHAYGMNDDAGGGSDAGGGYKVSEADADAETYGDTGEPLKRRRRDSGLGEEQVPEQEDEDRPRGRLTSWGFDVDEPCPGCPMYEGYGFD